MRAVAFFAMALAACATPEAPTCRTYSSGTLFFCSEDLSRTDDDAFVTTCEESGGTPSSVPCSDGIGTCRTVASDGSVRQFTAYFAAGSSGEGLCEYLGGAWTPTEGL